MAALGIAKVDSQSFDGSTIGQAQMHYEYSQLVESVFTPSIIFLSLVLLLSVFLILNRRRSEN